MYEWSHHNPKGLHIAAKVLDYVAVALDERTDLEARERRVEEMESSRREVASTLG